MLGRDDDDDDDGDGGERRDRRIGERRRARLARVRPPLASSPRGTARVASEAGAGASRAGSVAVRRGGSRVQGRGRTRGGIRRDQEAQDIQRQRRYATARRRATRPPPTLRPPINSRAHRPARTARARIDPHVRVSTGFPGTITSAIATPDRGDARPRRRSCPNPTRSPRPRPTPATFAFERSDSNCQKIVAAATRSFSPDPSTCSRPSIHSTASPR